ncbi:MAG: hypothetical protein GY768_28295 [Planctomycetaceae bacterium]|nr:hypothetical protein [Planctomycetaceae bacterium]
MRLSIILPALGPQSEFDNTLVSVLENRPASTEVVVPHTQEYQDPYNLSDEVRFVEANSDQPLHLLNIGIEASQGVLIHSLQSGMEATPGWTQSVFELFDAEPELAALAPSIQADSRSPIAGIRYQAGGTGKSVRVKRRQTAKPDGPCLEAGFFRASTLAAIGPFDEKLAVHHANADTAARLKRLELRTDHASDCLIQGCIPSRPAGFRSSQQIERVYHRHRGAMGSVVSLQHLLTVAANVTRHGPSFGVVTAMFGHCFGTVQSRLSQSTGWDPNDLASETIPYPEQTDQPDPPAHHYRRSA